MLIIAVVLVPKQSDYFQRLQRDFGKMHHSESFGENTLKGMGEFHYSNRLIFSQFEYSFGNITVSYYGFLSIILFKESKNRVPQSPVITV